MTEPHVDDEKREININMTFPKETSVTDTLALNKNIAANGRWFSALIVVICLTAFCNGYGSDYLKAAVIAVMPVGAAVIVDQMRPGWPRTVASIAIYSFSAAVPISLLLTIG